LTAGARPRAARARARTRSMTRANPEIFRIQCDGIGISEFS
jgi:hypothetical protein